MLDARRLPGGPRRLRHLKVSCVQDTTHVPRKGPGVSDDGTGWSSSNVKLMWLIMLHVLHALFAGGQCRIIQRCLCTRRHRRGQYWHTWRLCWAWKGQGAFAPVTAHCDGGVSLWDETELLWPLVKSIDYSFVFRACGNEPCSKSYLMFSQIDPMLVSIVVVNQC